ncbi:hypothetical protein PMIN02_004987 [Paraphaeosphaeria minitans]
MTFCIADFPIGSSNLLITSHHITSHMLSLNCLSYQTFQVCNLVSELNWLPSLVVRSCLPLPPISAYQPALRSPRPSGHWHAHQFRNRGEPAQRLADRIGWGDQTVGSRVDGPVGIRAMLWWGRKMAVGDGNRRPLQFGAVVHGKRCSALHGESRRVTMGACAWRRAASCAVSCGVDVDVACTSNGGQRQPLYGAALRPCSDRAVTKTRLPTLLPTRLPTYLPTYLPYGMQRMSLPRHTDIPIRKVGGARYLVYLLLSVNEACELLGRGPGSHVRLSTCIPAPAPAPAPQRYLPT